MDSGVAVTSGGAETFRSGEGRGSHMKIRVDQIERNPNQPRKQFSMKTIEALAETMKQSGDVDQPIIVVCLDPGKRYMLVEGERRWRAAKILKLTRISAIVRRGMSDKEIAIVSGRTVFCKEDLSPIEKANFLQQQMEEHQWSQTDVAKIFGPSPGYVANLLKLLNLEPSLQQLVARKEIGLKLALELASYAKEKQLQLHDALKKEEKLNGGKLLSADEALSLTRRVAERRRIKPVKATTAVMQRSQAQLAVDEFYRVMGKFEKSQVALGKLTSTQLESLRNPFATQLLADMRKTARFLQMKITQLEGRI